MFIEPYYWTNQIRVGGANRTIPVHVSEPRQNVRRFAKASVLLVVSPQKVHVTHFTLVLFDHVHQMVLQVRRVDLRHTENTRHTGNRERTCACERSLVPPGACRRDRPGWASHRERCGRARLEISERDPASAQTEGRTRSTTNKLYSSQDGNRILTMLPRQRTENRLT